MSAGTQFSNFSLFNNPGTEWLSLINEVEVSTAVSAGGNQLTNGITLGKNRLAANPWLGSISEFIAWPSNKSASRSALIANSNTYWDSFGPYANSWNGTQTSLLDTYTGAAAAYSLRALNSLYTGPLIRIRRSSDNAELDIYALANGDLDTTRLLAFVGSNSAYVTRWYDQSGNGRNAVNATTTQQPPIVSSGTLYTINGKPAMYGNGSTAYGIKASFTTANYPFTVIGVCEPASLTNNYLCGIGRSDTDTTYHTLYFASSTAVLQTRTAADGGDNASVSATVLQPYLLFGYAPASNNRNIAANGGSVGTNTADKAGPNPSDQLWLGRLRNGSIYFNGKYSEMLLWHSDESAGRTAIEADINTYWSIY